MAKIVLIKKNQGSEPIFIEHLLWIRFFTHITSLKYYKLPAKNGFIAEMEA